MRNRLEESWRTPPRAINNADDGAAGEVFDPKPGGVVTDPPISRKEPQQKKIV
jgi:hypothetical protein